jgi:twitching motility two-component system response regulator PilH
MKKLRVLIVDDVIADIEATATMLRTAGHEVMSTTDSNKGMKIAEIEQPDVILMDLVMPGVNGFQATRELGRNSATSHIPVIVISRKDEEIDRVWAQKQGARHYLTKGFDKTELLAALEAVVQPVANNENADGAEQP